MSLYQEISHCRVCKHGDLTTAIAFGEQYLASNFVRSNSEHPLATVKVPLTLVLCQGCGVVQLKESVIRDVLYQDYHYRSGINPMMRAALQDVVEDLASRVDLQAGDCVLDVGCNDCTLLSFFSEKYRRVGIDPARNINWESVDKSIQIINDYFSATGVLKATGGSLYKAVSSVAMLYGVENLNAFTSELKAILAPDGVWCIQLSYLPAIIKTLSFFDVCHEHLYYFSLRTVNDLLERNGLTIFDASTNGVNGGSLRVFVTHQENKREKSAGFFELLQEEDALHLTDRETYQKFFDDVCELKQKINGYIRHETATGNLVIGLGGSTKGNVLLQFFGIDNKMIPYISERNPEKVSLRTLGTDIELISEEQARQLNPSCMLLLIWFFKDEIIKRERPYLEQGGKLLFPMPYCHLVTKNGESRL